MRAKNINTLAIITLLVLISAAGNIFAQDLDSTQWYYRQYGRCWFGKLRAQKPVIPDTTAKVLQKTDTDEDDGRTYIIPVVFHIIHNDSIENIPDSYIYRQIDDLNRDFRSTGLYMNKPTGVNTKIKFCLAKVDPDGNPSTGIIRVKSPYTRMNTSSTAKEMLTKDLSRWDTKRYLNFWVVKNIDGNDSISGYSYLASEGAGDKNDGIVLNFRFVGSNNKFSPPPYSQGKTATHEVGHFFDLLHTWGSDTQGKGCNDDDFVDDTPPCDGPYFASLLCEEPFQCSTYRMTADYMDYSKDKCATLFTRGQADRMRLAIRKYRPTLVSYPNMLLIECDTFYNRENPITENILELHPNPTSSTIYLYPRFKEKLILSLSIYDNLGRHIKDIDNIEAITERIQLSIPELRPGIYHFIIRSPDIIYQNKIFILGRD